MADPAPIKETKGKQRDELLQQCLLWLRMLSLTSAAVCPQQSFLFGREGSTAFCFAVHYVFLLQPINHCEEFLFTTFLV